MADQSPNQQNQQITISLPPKRKNQFTPGLSSKPPHALPEEKAVAIALKSQGLTNTMIADILGRSCGSISTWIHASSDLAISEVANGIKKHGGAKRHIISDAILGRISDEDVLKASLLQKVTASAILTEKARLLEGESTQNVSVHSVVNRIDGEISKLQGELNNISP